MKSGFVNLIGRPNVGKSSILNRLIGQKLSIVTDKPQTTRVPMKFIYTDKNMQVVFFDNPGFQTPKNKLGEIMQETIYKNMNDADLNIYVMDNSLEIGRLDQQVLELAKKDKTDKLLLINKSDLLSAEDKDVLKKKYEDMKAFNEIVFISTSTGEGYETFKNVLYDTLKEGPQFYDEDEITDVMTRNIMEEVIREKCLLNLDEEIPHGIYVEMEEFVEEDTKVGMRATLYIERESHKPIIIGKNGSMINRIIHQSEKDMAVFLDKKVKLKIDIKIRKNWRKNKIQVGRWF